MKKLFILLGMLTIAGFGCETEGYVYDTDDCRIEINISENSPKTIFKRFICETKKTVDGELMEGTCYNFDLTKDGRCKTVTIYEKEPSVTCPKETPYLGYDDKCYGEWDTGRVDASEE